MSEASLHHWLIFAAVLAGGLVLDLAVFGPRREPKLKDALIESAGWIGLSCAFGVWVWTSLGRQAGVEFFTAYVVEKSLSVDNIFLFLVIFEAFQITRRFQHRVLFYGIAGALVMRALFVVAGVELLTAFHAVVYVLGGILLIAGFRMFFSPSRPAAHPERNVLVRVVRRFFAVTETCEDTHFFVKRTAGTYATPLFLALISVEAMDIVFAVDSVPAVLAITQDTFLAYSSNAFAILGLRALYFALADALPKLRFLHQGLAAILVVVGMKMVLSEKIRISTEASLGVLAVILLVTVAASLWVAKKKR